MIHVLPITCCACDKETIVFILCWPGLASLSVEMFSNMLYMYVEMLSCKAS